MPSRPRNASFSALTASILLVRLIRPAIHMPKKTRRPDARARSRSSCSRVVPCRAVPFASTKSSSAGELTAQRG
ncbi:uncharacterized protein GGS25DRAFT_467893 [Hypoxylon fragiforme]|uniref:uncharacterized protein n=1 Tax=Hypoxylon fragiforme TaxID=63214 RepID=UPI0020C73FC1|nr:uncharacterized protein GGS25DRAFT_467893 [Hypoxylon fragiforme]KAI2613599.1 hypothetical protein GGS25DRAFT_467893 [Hypoxylon fragiforme]